MQLFFHSISVILTTSSPVALAINCYVCGPASRDAFPASTESSANSNHLRPCEEFDASSNKTDFEKECPENFHGCITQIEGEEGHCTQYSQLFIFHWFSCNR